MKKTQKANEGGVSPYYYAHTDGTYTAGMTFDISTNPHDNFRFK